MFDGIVILRGDQMGMMGLGHHMIPYRCLEDYLPQRGVCHLIYF